MFLKWNTLLRTTYWYREMKEMFEHTSLNHSDPACNHTFDAVNTSLTSKQTKQDGLSVFIVFMIWVMQNFFKYLMNNYGQTPQFKFIFNFIVVDLKDMMLIASEISLIVHHVHWISLRNLCFFIIALAACTELSISRRLKEWVCFNKPCISSTQGNFRFASLISRL